MGKNVAHNNHAVYRHHVQQEGILERHYCIGETIEISIRTVNMRPGTGETVLRWEVRDNSRI